MMRAPKSTLVHMAGANNYAACGYQLPAIAVIVEEVTPGKLGRCRKCFNMVKVSR